MNCFNCEAFTKHSQESTLPSISGPDPNPQSKTLLRELANFEVGQNLDAFHTLSTFQHSSIATTKSSNIVNHNYSNRGIISKNNCDSFKSSFATSPLETTVSIPLNSSLKEMPHFGLSGGPNMAASAYGQTPPSPPLHHAIGGGGGNGGLMPSSPPHHHTHHHQHQHQQQQHHHQQQQHHHQHLAMLPRSISNNGGGTGNGISCGTIIATSSNPTLTTMSAASYRTHIEDKKLSREAMELYMRERNDMVIVILHAKVKS